jgi:hypothetical protein
MFHKHVCYGGSCCKAWASVFGVMINFVHLYEYVLCYGL